MWPEALKAWWSRRPTTTVFATPSPNELGFHTVQIDCMPNAGCTVFALFLCGQMLARGHQVACFPDVFDGQVALPERMRAERSSPRPHHYVAKLKLPHFWALADASDAPAPPCEFDGEKLTWRAWERVRPTVRILFLRDPLRNYLSLRSRAFCVHGGGMRAKLALADALFGREYQQRSAEPRGVRGVRRGRYAYDAVVFAEDIQSDADAAALAERLLGAAAVGTAAAAARALGLKPHKRLRRANVALGYAFGGDGRAGQGVDRRVGTGQAMVFPGPLYRRRAQPAHTAADMALVHAMAPRLSAAYRGSWAAAAPKPSSSARRGRAQLRSRACDGCLMPESVPCPNNSAPLAPRFEGRVLPAACGCAPGAEWAAAALGFNRSVLGTDTHPFAIEPCSGSAGARAASVRRRVYPSLRCADASPPPGQGGPSWAGTLSAHDVSRCHRTFVRLCEAVSAEHGDLRDDHVAFAK